jgi:hypothetical protein
MRESLLQLRLVAYRGLWDKFSGPGTLGAFVRARRKRIPFLVDLDAGAVTLRELVEEGLLHQPEASVFLMARAAGVPDEVAGSYLIEKQPEGAAAYPISVAGPGGALRRCGYYVPLAAAKDIRPADLPVTAGDFVLYESIDTIQSLDSMKRSPIRSDEVIEANLAFASRLGAVVMRVSDLVERELLLNSAKWIGP